MSQSGNRLGLTFAVLGAVGFSFKAILIKLAYPYGVDAVTLLALRMGLSLPFFLALGWADRRRRQPVPLTGRDWGLMLGLGVTGYYLASYLDFLGLQYISAALERLILFAYPTLVVLFSALFLGKPITRRAAGSIALCYAGIALAVAHDLDLGGDAHEVWLGGALVFGSAVSYALYLMGNGQAVGRLGAARVTAAASTIACVLCLVHFAATRPLGLLVQPAPVMGLAVALVFGSAVSYALYLMGNGQAVGRLGAARVTAAASTIACVLCLVHFAATRPLGLLVQPAPVMGLAVAMALFSTVLPVWMVSEAIRRLGAGPVSLIGTLGPVVTLFLGWLILAEPIGVYQLVGGALVIAGVLLVGSKR